MDLITKNSLLFWQFILLFSIGLFIFSLIDVLKSSFQKNDKLIWILVILFVPILGSILYLSIGRKQKMKLN
ncbi:MAG: PLD nuclease N-terminal domain-containing protein [Flavobacteriaceae bacterium]|nr:PLD nuclease N-terminal domain-containing protein [Flavobacteriaceae bacterium]